MYLSLEKAKDTLTETIWERPEYYGGFNPVGEYVLYSRNRDSDALENSNYVSMFKHLREAAEALGAPNSVYDWRASHWACGWVEYLMLKPDAPESLLIEAAEILNALSDYPVFDENHFSETEQSEANEIWRECYSVRERADYIRQNAYQFEFHGFADMRACLAGEYFAGYASELIA